MSYLNTTGSLNNYVTLADTSFTKQSVSTSIVALSDTLITYTPESNAEKVIYECALQIAWNPDAAGSLMCARLQYSENSGASWTTYDGSKIFAGNFSSSTDYNWHTYLFKFHLNSWSGSRQLRLAARSYGTNSEFTLGRSFNASGTEGVGAAPLIMAYSVIG
tara:strand:+ start:1387 stop:1872 length:486 start_codon:yes stop_codon:yes gene_type:complete